ncbi:MAG: PQQ-like beta-propeller repeat protein [Chitinispirillales bacterium]|jgi:outer membrane protein assembly factor BamB|nr:PQQ-like beta-propeller repeat protein [Chitinispirillales bacterium]
MTVKLKTLMAATAITAAVAATALAADWPAFHGPDRTNRSRETGLLRQWPQEGPRKLWTATGIGNGYSGVVTSRGIIYTAGVKNNQNFLFALDSDGKILWETPAGRAWVATRAFARSYVGTRSTPTVDPASNTVFLLSDTGVLIAADAATGALKWQVNIPEKYGAEMPLYGYTESPVIDGDAIFVSAYGTGASVVALNKNTGAEIWASPSFGTRQSAGDAGYASPIIIDNNGFRQLVSFSSAFLYGMDTKTGRLLWTVPMANNRENNCTDPIYVGNGHIFASSGYGRGSMLVKLELNNRGEFAPRKVYDVKLMDNHHGGVILHDGHIYGSGHESRGWFCINAMTGRQVWNAPGKGAVTFADGMLYLYGEDGAMSLARATPQGFNVISSFQVPEGELKSYFWAHPVVSHGVLYVRYADQLHAYAVK